MTRHCSLLVALLLTGCSRPAPAPPVAPAVPAPVLVAPSMPAPIIMDARRQDKAPDANPDAVIGTIGHPAPDGMLIDAGGDPCQRERSGCHPKGALIDGRVWPDYAVPPQVAPAETDDTRKARFNEIAAQRYQIHSLERSLYVVLARTDDTDPRHTAAADSLRQCRSQDDALTQEQRVIFMHFHDQAEDRAAAQEDIDRARAEQSNPPVPASP